MQEREHDTAQMASLLFDELIYPEAHPYHWSNLGYPDTIARLTASDLEQFHARYFAPQGMVLVIVGAVKAEDAVQAVTAALGDWQGDRPARTPLPPVPALTERRERRITIPDKTQSNLILGWPGPERLHPDFIPCFVGNTVLGVFGMYGRLGQSVRIQNGLAYYAYSSLDGGVGPGPWSVVAGVNPANVDRVIELVLAELRRFRDELVPSAELEDAKSYLTGSLPLQLETNEGVARALLNIERYQLGLDYLRRYRDMMMAITSVQVRDAARRWLNPEHFALSVVNPETPTDVDHGG
jgi:zinc protease